ALFEAACRLGALVAAQGSSALAEGLGAFARGIGLAFQLLDDVLDVSGPVERTGKARGTDLLEGTVTLPLILARERERDLARFELGTLSGPAQAEELCERIAATGALDEARERALAVVEALDGRLLENPLAPRLALRAAKDDAPVSGPLFGPVQRVDEFSSAVKAHVEVGRAGPVGGLCLGDLFGLHRSSSHSSTRPRQ